MQTSASHVFHRNSCEFGARNIPCSEAFQLIYTDFGGCFIFNGEQNILLTVNDTGNNFGLKVTINLEQYEYMAGMLPSIMIFAIFFWQLLLPGMLNRFHIRFQERGSGQSFPEPCQRRNFPFCRMRLVFRGQCRLGRMTMESTRREPGYSLISLLVYLHHLLRFFSMIGTRWFHTVSTHSVALLSFPYFTPTFIHFSGSSQSAGIKALILHKEEEPFVRSLGVTVLPGTHALVGVELSEVRIDIYGK